MKKYKDLYSLLEDDIEAKEYFNSIPDYVKEGMSQRADSVNSFESLCHFVYNFTKGDC